MSTFQLTFSDETLSGNVLDTWEMAVETPIMPLKDLILMRVEEEIRRMEKGMESRFLAYQNREEKLLNNSKKPELPDAEASGYRALKAFQEQAFFVLVDERQVQDLEQMIELRPDSKVSFVKLTPLVGG